MLESPAYQIQTSIPWAAAFWSNEGIVVPASVVQKASSILSSVARSSRRLPSFHAALLSSSWESVGFTAASRRAASSGLKNPIPAWIRASPARVDLPAPLVPANTVIRDGRRDLATPAGTGYGCLAQLFRRSPEQAIDGGASLGGLHPLQQLVEFAAQSVELGLGRLLQRGELIHGDQDGPRRIVPGDNDGIAVNGLVEKPAKHVLGLGGRVGPLTERPLTIRRGILPTLRSTPGSRSLHFLLRMAILANMAITVNAR